MLETHSVLLEIKGPVSFWDLFSFLITENFMKLQQLTAVGAGP